jgi:hypothetical protein
VRCEGAVAGDEHGAMRELAVDAVPQVGLHVLVAETVPQQEDEQVGLPPPLACAQTLSRLRRLCGSSPSAAG